MRRAPTGLTKGLPVLIAVGVLTACATSEEIAVVSQQLQTAQQRNAELEIRVQEIKGQDLSAVQGQWEIMRRDLESLQSGLDDETAQVFALRQELTERLKQVERRLEEANQRMAALEQSLAQMPETLRVVVAKLTTQMDHQAQVVAKLEEAMRPVETRAQAEPLPSNGAVQEPLAVLPPPASEAKPEGAPNGGGMAPEAKVAYEQAYQRYKNKQYEGAVSAFQQFLIRHPDSPQAPNAHFWMGECYIRLRTYERGIEAYEQVVTSYPKSEKAPRALYRKAMALLKLNDTEAARTTLRRLLDDYPQSEDVKQARAKLNALK